jgi:hypothetical protein
METEDLSSYTPLSSTTVTQSLKVIIIQFTCPTHMPSLSFSEQVPFHQTFETLRHFIGQMYDLTSNVNDPQDDDKYNLVRHLINLHSFFTCLISVGCCL